ncbi:MAG: PadR family transcriptional regulator [Bdellovibrionaceae bacterium]|nr:PadR family transcriptional regulator [Pseudobdellovibrionaceae bacterium]
MKHAILAVLSHGDRTGYDLTCKMDGSVANFWPATHQQIYIELKQLDALGFVRFKEKVQKGRPNKKIYKMTNAGLCELKAWAEEPIEMAPSKDALLIKVFASHALGTKQFANELNRLRELHEAKLLEYQEIEKNYFSGKVPPRLLAQYLTLRRGIIFERSWLEWCDESIKRL